MKYSDLYAAIQHMIENIGEYADTGEHEPSVYHIIAQHSLPELKSTMERYEWPHPEKPL